MADILPPHPPTPPPPGTIVWAIETLSGLGNLLLTKVLPAMAGAIISDLFQPRPPLHQRLLKILGGVMMAIYFGEVAAALLWHGLAWCFAKLGVPSIDGIIERGTVDQLAPFLVGLLGMTIAEAALVYIRAWLSARTPKSGPP